MVNLAAFPMGALKFLVVLLKKKCIFIKKNMLVHINLKILFL